MESDPYKHIRRGIWLYAILIVLEGAVRKWGPPVLSDPFLIARAPIALVIYALAFGKGVFPSNLPTIAVVGLAVGTGIFAMLTGHGNPLVTAYGIQYNFLHFPLIWIIANVMEKSDVMKIGALFIVMSIPNSLLMVMQDVSSELALVNRGVGGSFGGQIDDGSGGIRPPGLFSFTTGNNLFYPIVAAFLFSQLTERRNVHWLILFSGIIGVAAAITVCGSRTMVIACGITLASFLFSLSKKGLLNGKIIAVLAVTPVVFILLYSALPELQQGWSAFTRRWEVTTSDRYGGVEGAVFLRILAGFTNFTHFMAISPFFGYGIGMGSNVGSVLMTGSMSFLLAEDEWSRIIQEMGPIFGFVFIVFRAGVAVGIVFKSFQALFRDKNALPLMLATTGALAMLQGQIAPPTMLGFTILSAGLTLAACNNPDEEEDDEEDLEDDDDVDFELPEQDNEYPIRRYFSE